MIKDRNIIIPKDTSVLDLSSNTRKVFEFLFDSRIYIHNKVFIVQDGVDREFYPNYKYFDTEAEAQDFIKLTKSKEQIINKIVRTDFLAKDIHWGLLREYLSFFREKHKADSKYYFEEILNIITFLNEYKLYKIKKEFFEKYGYHQIWIWKA